MKKLISFLIFNLWAIYLMNAQPVSSAQWQLIPDYSDEFNTSTLNTTKWISYNDCSLNLGAKFSSLNIKTGQLASDGSGNRVMQIITNTLASAVTCETSTIKYESGRINFRDPSGSSVLKYGYFELRCKLSPGGRNSAASFWLVGSCPTAEPEDNMYNEIDIFENNSLYASRFNDAIHAGRYICPPPIPYATIYAYNNYNHERHGNSVWTNIDFTSAFHTIGMDWQPGYVDYYIDGQLYCHTTELARNPDLSDNAKLLYPDPVRPVSDLFVPMNVQINGGTSSGEPLINPSNDIFEVDYFHYYKRKPVITDATYNSSNNTITLTVNTQNPGDTYFWEPNSGYITINGPTNTNIANISVSPAYNGTSVKVTATGTYPSASSSSIFTFVQSSGNICSIPATNNIYLATNIFAPKSGCSSVIVAADTYVAFVSQNEITLNPGFEVKLGGTFMAFTE